MKITTTKKHIANAYHKKISPMIWGPPGVGKSSIVKQVAQEMGIQLIDLRLTQLEPPDLRGIMAPNHTTKKAESFYPAFLPESGKGILFLDEIEKAPVSVKNAALELILDRRIGSYVLPEGWGVVGAGNREDDGCFSAPLGSALCNRMIHFHVEPDYEAWLGWARNHNISDGILGYLAFRPDHLFRYEAGDTAFPSPRSWEMLNTMLDGIESPGDQNDIMKSTIGDVTSLEYRTWHTVYRNVKVEDIILKGKMPDFDKAEKGKEKSFEYAVTIAVAHYTKNRKDFNDEVMNNISKFLSYINPELRLCFCKQIPTSKLSRMLEHPALTKIGSKIVDIIMGSN